MSKKVKDTFERGHEDIKDTGDVAREGWVPHRKPWASRRWEGKLGCEWRPES